MNDRLLVQRRETATPAAGHAALVSDLLEAVRSSDGDSSREMRGAIVHGASTGTDIDRYIALVRFESYALTADHIRSLTTTGWSEDAVFELTITAAVAEAHRRLAAGLEAMREGGS